MRAWLGHQAWDDGPWVCRTGEQEKDARGRARARRIGIASILRVGLNGRRSIQMVRAADEMLKEGSIFPARWPVELRRLDERTEVRRVGNECVTSFRSRR